MQVAIAIILCILLSVLEIARIHESIMIAQAIQRTYVGFGSADKSKRIRKRSGVGRKTNGKKEREERNMTLT